MSKIQVLAYTSCAYAHTHTMPPAITRTSQSVGPVSHPIDIDMVDEDAGMAPALVFFVLFVLNPSMGVR